MGQGSAKDVDALILLYLLCRAPSFDPKEKTGTLGGRRLTTHPFPFWFFTPPRSRSSLTRVLHSGRFLGKRSKPRSNYRERYSYSKSKVGAPFVEEWVVTVLFGLSVCLSRQENTRQSKE